jgi:16S rRNA G1207 methylase RsmC
MGNARCQMATNQGKTVCVVVKLRDLDTDARAVFEHDVVAPRDASEQRARLVEVVAQHKPKAEIRSFANYTAGFVDSEHLVVAYFKEPREMSLQRGQRELFASASADEAA